MENPRSASTFLQDLLDSGGARSPLLSRMPESTVQAVGKMLAPVLASIESKDSSNPRLSKSAVLDLGKQIEESCHSHVQRWRYKTTLNLLIEACAEQKLLKPQYLNIPQQIPRHLVVTFEGIAPDALQMVLEGNSLLNRTPLCRPPIDWPHKPGIWEFLLFYASLTLSSHVLIPKLDRKLVHLQEKHLRSKWLTLPSMMLNPELVGGGLRFPLTSQTQRCLQHLKAAIQAHYKPKGDYLCPDEWRTGQWFKFQLANAWLSFLKLQMKMVAPIPASIRIRKLLELGRVVALLDGIPPFLVAVLSGYSEGAVDPMTPLSFSRVFTPSTISRSGRTMPPPPRSNGKLRNRAIGNSELFDLVEQARKAIRRDMSRVERREIANALERQLGTNRPTIGSSGISCRNAWCYGQWVISMLRGPYRPGTVMTWSSAIAAAFFPIFANHDLSSWSAATWVSQTQAAMRDHETSAAKKAIREFYAFLVEEGFTPLHKDVGWDSEELRKHKMRHPMPLVGFKEFRNAMSYCEREDFPRPLVPVLRTKLILGFLLGLRSMEATWLRLSDLELTPDPILRIEHTKTEHGIRTLHLGMLLPQQYLDELRAFHSARLIEAGGNPGAPLLATKEHPSRYDSSYLASLAGIPLRRAVQEPVCFHHLRHAFASWILIRLLAAAGTITLDTQRLSFAQESLFQNEALKALRPLLFGFGPQKQGQEWLSHALIVMCRLLGHSNPTISLTSYVHSTEILLSILNRRQFVKRGENVAA